MRIHTSIVHHKICTRNKKERKKLNENMKKWMRKTTIMLKQGKYITVRTSKPAHNVNTQACRIEITIWCFLFYHICQFGIKMIPIFRLTVATKKIHFSITHRIFKSNQTWWWNVKMQPRIVCTFDAHILNERDDFVYIHSLLDFLFFSTVLCWFHGEAKKKISFSFCSCCMKINNVLLVTRINEAKVLYTT